jgi:SNF2 family DNA or RNA helicase
MALTGTPIENHPYELWSHLNLVARGWFPNRSIFHSACISAQTGGKALESIHVALAPFLLRRTRKEVLTELPPLTVQIMPCEMATTQRKLYNQWLFAARRAFKEGTERTRRKGAVLEAILRLRQMCCDPALLEGPRSHSRPSGKTDAVVQAIIQANEYSKILVFSQFASYLEILRQELSERNIPNLMLIGRTRDRGSVIKRFQEAGGPNVFLISLKAGGVGLNLMAANYVFLCDPWWNPAVEMQAWSRAYRIGQTQAVTVLRFICTDTIEEKVLDLQKEKDSLNALLPEQLGKDDLGHLLGLV